MAANEAIGRDAGEGSHDIEFLLEVRTPAHQSLYIYLNTETRKLEKDAGYML